MVDKIVEVAQHILLIKLGSSGDARNKSEEKSERGSEAHC